MSARKLFWWRNILCVTIVFLVVRTVEHFMVGEVRTAIVDLVFFIFGCFVLVHFQKKLKKVRSEINRFATKEEARAAAKRLERWWLWHPQVCGVGVVTKDGNHVVRVYLVDKAPRLLPTRVNGVEVVRIVSGEVKAF